MIKATIYVTRTQEELDEECKGILEIIKSDKISSDIITGIADIALGVRDANLALDYQDNEHLSELLERAKFWLLGTGPSPSKTFKLIDEYMSSQHRDFTGL